MAMGLKAACGYLRIAAIGCKPGDEAISTELY